MKYDSNITKQMNSDIMGVIFLFLKFYDKHTFKRMSRRNNKNKITICETCQIDDANTSILMNYPHIISINISNNKYVTNLNHMSDLKKLSIYNDSFGDEEIKNFTNLEELDISNNMNITSLNHMTKLKRLTNVHNTKITDDGLKNLTNLTYLNISGNKTLKYINQMTELVELHIDCTNIQNDGIYNLTNVKILDISCNFNIKNLNHMLQLEVLIDEFIFGDLKHVPSIDDGIQKLNLKELYIDNNHGITKIGHMTNLKMSS